MKTLFGVLGLVVSLSGCGGGGSSVSQIDQLRAQALAKEAEAITLGVDQPCVIDNMCDGLRFANTDTSCSAPPVKAYSLLGPKVKEAEAAAAEQRSLAAQVIALLPPANPPCPVLAAPTFSCTAQRCVKD